MAKYKIVEDEGQEKTGRKFIIKKDQPRRTPGTKLA